MSTFQGELRDDPPQFDEHALDLDNWNRYQALRAAEQSAHDRLDRALCCMGGGSLDLHDGELGPSGPAQSADILPERSAARDSWTLDAIAQILRDQNEPADSMPDVRELIRSTGRTC